MIDDDGLLIVLFSNLEYLYQSISINANYQTLLGVAFLTAIFLGNCSFWVTDNAQIYASFSSDKDFIIKNA